jgi:hypothetical protein
MGAGPPDRGALVATGDEHEHQVGGLGIKRDVADLVEDEQWDPVEPAQLILEAALTLGLCEQRDPFGGGAKDHPLAGEAGTDRERDRQDASMSVKSRS